MECKSDDNQSKNDREKVDYVDEIGLDRIPETSSNTISLLIIIK